MNKKQKYTLVNSSLVIVITSAAVVGMVEVKNGVNRAEAMRAMDHLGKMALKYREQYGAIPPESYVDGIKSQLEGSVRMGQLHYRARWIDFDSKADEILAYVEKDYRSLLFHSGVVVLRLDGRVEWLDKKSFSKLLASQQDPLEIEVTRK
jgi:hypothetical protein